MRTEHGPRLVGRVAEAFISVVVVATFISGCDFTATYKAPMIPVTFSVDNNGNITVGADTSIVTPFGEFSIGADYPIKQADDGLIVVLRNRHKGSNGTDTIYKIRTDEDSFSADVDGKVSFSVNGRQITVDVTDAKSVAIHSSTQGQQPTSSSSNTVGQRPASGEIKSCRPSQIPPLSEVSGTGDYELVKAALSNMKTLRSFHTEYNIISGAKSWTAKGDVDVVHCESRFVLPYAGVDNLAIIINDGAYISKDGGRTYQAYDISNLRDSSAGMIGEPAVMTFGIDTDKIEMLKNLLKEGNPAYESIDSLAVKHLVTNFSGTILDLWVTTDTTPFLAKLEFVQGNNSGYVKWSKFNEDFDVRAPPSKL